MRLSTVDQTTMSVTRTKTHAMRLYSEEKLLTVTRLTYWTKLSLALRERVRVREAPLAMSTRLPKIVDSCLKAEAGLPQKRHYRRRASLTPAPLPEGEGFPVPQQPSCQ